MAIEEAEDTEGAEEEPEYEWNLQAVNADTAAADEGENLQRVKVAVLDSGVDMVSGIDLSGTVNLVEEEQYLSELARKLKLTRSSINGWEMGLSVPSTAVVVELAKVFNVSTDYLLGLDNNASINITGLSEKEVAVLCDLIKCFKNE